MSEWTVRDALTVLDELDRRLSVVEAITKLAGDPHTDELHALHPLVTEAKWLFGHEFDSPEFVANVSLSTAMRDVFKKRVTETTFLAARNRVDLLVLGDATISGVATEQVDERSGLVFMSKVLLVEVKRGGSEIVREHVHHATDYLEDFLRSGLIEGQPEFRVYVVGHRVSEKVEPYREVGRGKVHVATYSQLVRSAQKRLFRLRERLTSRYESLSGLELMTRVLGEPEQMSLANTAQ